MRHSEGMPLMRRLAVIVAGAAMLGAVAVPAAAMAATPHSTLILSPIYQAKARTLTVSGRIAASTHGKRIRIEIRKPGRTFWTLVGQATISRTGRWSFKYMPKLGGTFYIRSRYTVSAKGLSRTARLIVRKGPGVKYTLTLASTTSTRDSGLFEALRPMFLRSCPEYSLKATFVGSGASIALGGSGDADVVLTHSPAAEINFMHGLVGNPLVPSAHRGLTRFKVMYNDYVLVGPPTDPAGIAIGDSPAAAFGKVADTDSTFLSRNDNSGTNAKEKEIWAGIGNPQTGQSWYKASGTMGMAAALSAAKEQNAYTLADRATWLNAKNLGTTGTLIIVNEGGSAYFNQYSVMEVSGAKNAEGAQDFRRWIMSPAAQRIIREYGLDTYGRALFVPNAGSY